MVSCYQDDVEVVYEKLNERVQDLRYEVRTQQSQLELPEVQFRLEKSSFKNPSHR